MTFAKKALILGTAASFGGGLVITAAALAAATINGAGATFPAPFYQASFAGLANKGIKVNYQSVGSGAGVRQFVAGTVDFGATDEPIKPAEAAKVKRGVVQFPATGGTIAVAYNNPSCPALKLTQMQVVGIFLGQINTWEELKCGSGPIKVVHRSDGSGTTFAFTNSLSAFSSEWKSKVGEGKSVKWPVGVGGKGNEGVAGTISNTPGSIGYISEAFVRGKIKAAAVQNKAGRFVKPNAKSGAAALNNIQLNSMLAGEDANPAGATSYPISTLSWILAYKTGNGEKAEVIQQAMEHLLASSTQFRGEVLGFIPLKGSILEQSRRAINSIGK
ncbi:MAG: phosphate ABC transporter substrate-binding protein PstS [Synechococcaceae cyanobacterium ELA263]